MNDKKLLSAQRQYMHNNGEGFVFGYDAPSINNYIAEIKRDKAELEALIVSNYGSIRAAYKNGDGSYDLFKKAHELMEAIENE